jgi:hypothetical protein
LGFVIYGGSIMSHLYDVNKLIAKYGIDQPPDPDNPEGESILAGARNNPDNWLLLDPVRSPELYALITGAYHNLRKVKPERCREHGEPEPFGGKVVELEWKRDGCCINIADQCDVFVTNFPVSFGGLTVVFKICEACRAKAGFDARTGFVLSAIAANEAARREPPERPR